MKLTLRDLLWLLLLVAGLTAWALQHQQNAERYRRTRVHNPFVRRDRFVSPSPAAIQRRIALQRLGGFDDAALEAHFAAIMRGLAWRHADYEPCLVELSQRGMAGQLDRYYRKVMSRERDGIKWSFPDPENLELLAALRRAQRRPDPLRCLVTVANRDDFGIKSPAPIIEAKMMNVDTGGEPVYFQHGGDYRGGRMDRWRVLLIDQRGRAVGDSNHLALMGGGVSSFGPLQHVKTDHGSRFDLRRYVAPPRPGKYQLQLLYHNSYRIADEPDLSGLIVMKSQPIAVTVENPAYEKQWVFGRELVPMLAIAAAGVGLAFAGRVRGKRLSRRDLVWAVLICGVAFSFWLDHCRQLQQIADLQPDAEAKWSIRLTSSN
jgi:hypothetical protein